MRTALLFAFCLIGLPPAGAPPASGLKLVDAVEKIWDKGGHNAFTDLIRFQDRWYCVAREGAGHAAGAGTLRVLVSKDGNSWGSAALIASNDVDLRAPHL